MDGRHNTCVNAAMRIGKAEMGGFATPTQQQGKVGSQADSRPAIHLPTAIFDRATGRIRPAVPGPTLFKHGAVLQSLPGRAYVNSPIGLELVFQAARQKPP